MNGHDTTYTKHRQLQEEASFRQRVLETPTDYQDAEALPDIPGVQPSPVQTPTEGGPGGAEATTEGAEETDIDRRFRQFLVEFSQDELFQKSLRPPSDVESMGAPDELRQGPMPSLRQQLTERLGEGFAETQFGRTLQDFGVLDMVPVADVALAIGDIENIQERKRRGIHVPFEEELGARMALPFAVVGAGMVAKKGVQSLVGGAADALRSFRSMILGTPKSVVDRIAEEEAAKVAQISDEVVEEGLATLGEFYKWAGDDVAEYLPDRFLNINYRHIGSNADIKAALDVVEEGMKRPDVKPWGDTLSAGQRLADDLGVHVDRLRKTYEKLGRLDEEVYAARVVLSTSAKNVSDLAKMYDPAWGEMEKAAALRVVRQHVEIMDYVSGISALPGRALNSQKLLAAEISQNNNAIGEAIAEFGGTGRIDKLMDALARGGDSSEINNIASRGVKDKFWNAATELWINGILSGAKTLTVNLTGNALFTAWQIPERAIAGTIGAVRASTGQEIDRVYIGEAVALLYGGIKGTKDALKAAGTAFWTGQPSVGTVTKVETRVPRAISSEELGVTGIPGMAVDLIGTIARVPTRIMLVQDEYFKAAGRQMQLHALAYREGMKSGGNLQDRVLKMMDVVDNPSQYKHVGEDANEFAHYITFQRALGEKGLAVQKFVNAPWGTIEVPALKFLMPFVRTPANIFKAGILERNPVFAPMSSEFKQAIQKGGAEKDLALAKVSAGTMLAMYVMSEAMEGNITGAGPADPRQRQAWLNAGYRPYSVRVQTATNDDGSPQYEWFQFQRLEPISFIAGAIADSMEFMKYMEQDDPQRIDEVNNYLAMVISALAENTTNKTFLSGLTNFVDVINNPKMSAERWTQSFGSSFVPNAFRDIATVNDPYMREVESVGQAIRAKTPGLSKDLPPVRNVWGEPRVKDEGWLMGLRGVGLPINVSAESQHRIDHVIMRLGVDGVKDEFTGETKIYREALVGKPSRSIKGVRLTAEEFDKYVYLQGQGIELPLFDGKERNQLKTMNWMVNQKWFHELEPGAQALMIKQVHSSYVEAARNTMLEDIQPRLQELERIKLDTLESLEGIDQ